MIMRLLVKLLSLSSISLYSAEVKPTHQLAQIQSEIINSLNASEDKLLAIRNSKDSLVQKWQQFLQVILPIQLEVIKAYGFTDNQSGLSQFNELYAHHSLKSEPLLNLNRQKWLFLFDKAFDIAEFREVLFKKLKI